MSIVLALVLAIVQALTEFLPVSSSGHLVIFQTILGKHSGGIDAPLAFDVFVHLATFCATLVYFREDVWRLLTGIFRSGESGEWARGLATRLILAMFPAAVVGLTLKSDIEVAFHSTKAAAFGFLITSIVLELAHRRQAKFGERVQDSDLKLTLLQAFIIGCAQAFALLPGVSRSGTTICTGLLLGLPVASSIRFSFLLSLPTIFGAALVESSALMSISKADYAPFGLAFLVSALVGFWALSLFVRLLQGTPLRAFALYTACLSGALFLFT